MTKNYWRMAMKDGNLGKNMFPEFKKLGIAAICYWMGDKTVVSDCRKLTKKEYEKIWNQKDPKNVVGRVSLGRVAYEMKEGDVIYVKDGTIIAGKGTITRGYQYRVGILEKAPWWNHFVTVRWETDFRPIKIKLGAEQWTVLPLEGERLEKLRQAEIMAGNKNGENIPPSLPGEPKLPIDTLTQEQSAPEGELKQKLVTHRKRETKLRKAKILQEIAKNGRLCCQVEGCGFDFYKVYGELGKEFAHVHHLKPLGKRDGNKSTFLKDLAIVCANCHAMVHRGGDSRSLKGLIRKR